jgi:hypothetical protein
VLLTDHGNSQAFKMSNWEILIFSAFLLVRTSRTQTISEITMEHPPPPYTAGSFPPDPPADHVAPVRNPLEQLRRYVIEIMAFTFDANFSLLNIALGQPSYPKNSTLTPTERAKLLELATLMIELKTRVTKGGPMSYGGTQFLSVRSRDRETIADAVLRPALHLGASGGYLLEFIGGYAVHQCDPSKRDFSFISRRKPYFYRFWRSLEFLGPFNITLGIFTNDLWGCAKVIEGVVDNEDVRIILAEAMNVYQKDVLGITAVEHIGRVFEDRGWKRLGTELITEEESNAIQSERWGRERAATRKKVESNSLRYL